MPDFSDQIKTESLKPQSVAADGVTVTRRSLKEQIEVARYLRGTTATDPTNQGLGFRIQQIVPSGGPQ